MTGFSHSRTGVSHRVGPATPSPTCPPEPARRGTSATTLLPVRVRWIGLTLALVALGALVGWGLGAVRDDEPATFATAAPVPAHDPSIPVIPVRILPDPTTPPPLATGLRLRPRTVGTPPFDLGVPVPKGWVQTNPTSGEWRWYPAAGLTVNTYFLRVRLVGNSYRPVSVARDQRIGDLEGAGGVDDFHLEQRTAGGFVANYVADQHRRLAMEEFIGRRGSDTAYAWIALIGREADRAGLADLLRRIVAGART